MKDSVRFRWRSSNEISSADLVRQCGQKLGDRSLWELFQQRFQKRIFLYLMRVLKFHSKRDDVPELVSELAQEVYLRLVQNKGIMLCGFRGESELSVAAFLARVSASVAIDYLRYSESQKRLGNLVSLEEVKEMLENSPLDHAQSNLEAILKWIDVQKLAANDPDQKNAQRNAIIFKLHFIDGLTTEEIAEFPGFDLTERGVGSVITRLRKRIRT